MIFVRLKGIQHLILWVYVGSLSTCVCEHIKYASMEEETEDLQDDYIYPSYFKEELDYVLQVEDLSRMTGRRTSTYRIMTLNLKVMKKFIKDYMKIMWTV